MKGMIATNPQHAQSDHGLPAQQAGRDRRQGALPRLHRTGAGDGDREGADRRALDPRVQLQIANSDVKIFTRRGHDWTMRFKRVADAAFHVSAASAILDGEITMPAADGTTDFSVLQNELKGKSTRIVMVAFDLLYLNGYDLRKLPLVERKAHQEADRQDRHPV